jgi:hypothetical protein
VDLSYDRLLMNDEFLRAHRYKSELSNPDRCKVSDKCAPLPCLLGILFKNSRLCQRLQEVSPVLRTIVYHHLWPEVHYSFLTIYSFAIFFIGLILSENYRLSVPSCTPLHVWEVGESAALKHKRTERKVANDGCQVK